MLCSCQGYEYVCVSFLMNLKEVVLSAAQQAQAWDFITNESTAVGKMKQNVGGGEVHPFQTS